MQFRVDPTQIYKIDSSGSFKTVDTAKRANHSLGEAGWKETKK